MDFKSSIHELIKTRIDKVLRTIGKDEAEQIAVRFIVAGVVVIYTSLGQHGQDIKVLSWSLSLAQAFAFAYLLTFFLSSFSVFIMRLSRPTVRFSMMAIDIIFFSAAMAIIPEAATPLFFIYFLIVLGFGFRFGNVYLFTAMTLSIIGFLIAFTFGEFWQAHRSFGFSLLLVLMMVSVYLSFFIKRLNIAKKKMEIAVIKADAANEAKTNFLSNMSHELRTPLNGVISVSELLSETKLSGTQKEYADTIQSSARTLLELVNHVLDFSKIEAGKVILDNICFDLHACINEAIKIIKPLADRKNIPIYNNVSNGTPQFIYGDPVRLKQILINLANNAAKFTEQGHISLHTYTTNLSSESVHLCFEVIDTGIGISPVAQSRIFERFVQEDDSTTRQFGGTGLGTSIAKQLVELMGGVIGVTSNPGKGSRFWFEIDVAVASSREFSSLAADVLIVSNNEKLVTAWKSLFDGWNRKCIIINDMGGALKVLRMWQHSKTKCSILLDGDALHMPPVRAAQLIKDVGIKETVLMLSSMNPMQINNPGVQMYFDAILDVPVDGRQLYHALMGVTEYERAEGVVSLSLHMEQRASKKILPLTILVAEDQSTNQFVFRRILETQGHHISMVDDGQKALDILVVEKFDVVIVDLNMPHVSGLEVMKMFKFMAPDNKMPFIVVTANSSQETLRECSELADAVLVKPVEKQQLLDVIYKLTSRKPSITGHDNLPESHFSDLPILDVASLDDMLGQTCDAQFLAELFMIFGKDAERLINQISQSTRYIEDLPQAKRSAHALKGIATNVSAKQLALIALYCEDEIQTNPDITRQADKLINELNSSLLVTKTAMQNYLKFKRTQLIDS